MLGGRIVEIRDWVNLKRRRGRIQSLTRRLLYSRDQGHDLARREVGLREYVRESLGTSNMLSHKLRLEARAGVDLCSPILGTMVTPLTLMRCAR